MWHMSFCSTVGFICIRVLGLVKSHNMSTKDYMQRVMPIGAPAPPPPRPLLRAASVPPTCASWHRPLPSSRVWHGCSLCLEAPVLAACEAASSSSLWRQRWLVPTSFLRHLLPAGVLYAASLWLSNSAYLYLSVSFIQMTKSLMPGLVYASGVLLGTEQYQVRQHEAFELAWEPFTFSQTLQPHAHFRCLLPCFLHCPARCPALRSARLRQT